MVGVVSTEAPAYALSWAAGKVVQTNSADTIADGVAVRAPMPRRSTSSWGADRIVQVSDDEIAAAMRAYYGTPTSSPRAPARLRSPPCAGARPPGAARRWPWCAGGNIDRPLYLRLLADRGPV